MPRCSLYKELGGIKKAKEKEKLNTKFEDEYLLPDGCVT